MHKRTPELETVAAPSPNRPASTGFTKFDTRCLRNTRDWMWQKPQIGDVLGSNWYTNHDPIETVDIPYTSTIVRVDASRER